MKLEYKEDNHTITEEFPMENIGTNEAFLNLLKTKNIETLHSGETTLEEIFIKVTGVRLNSHE
jgi:fluoroquinolone transport system ATP-binding protein